MENRNSSDKNKNSVLIADTEVMLCELMQFRFESAGFSVDIVHSGEEALRLPLENYTIVIADLMETSCTGIDIAKAIKRNPDTRNVSVIITSKLSSEDDIVNSLDAGADDFVAKPFTMRILEARVRSVVRRRLMFNRRRASTEYTYRTLTVDTGLGHVSIDGKPVSLSKAEFQILSLLISHRGQFFDRTEIQNETREDDNVVSERAIDTTISRLRKKLGEYGRNIINRQGFGYGFLE